MKRSRFVREINGVLAYWRGGILLICGDSHTVLRYLKSGIFDFICGDYPYGTKSKGVDCTGDGANRFEKLFDVRHAIHLALPLLKPGGRLASFYEPMVSRTPIYHIDHPDLNHHEGITWDKMVPGGKWPGFCVSKSQEEIAVSAYRSKDAEERPYTGEWSSSVWRIRRLNDNQKIHYCEKPVELMRKLIRTYARLLALMLDICSGSGAFLEAAAREGRRCVGIEIEEEYFYKIAARIDRVFDEIGDAQLSLEPKDVFIEPGSKPRDCGDSECETCYPKKVT